MSPALLDQDQDGPGGPHAMTAMGTPYPQYAPYDFNAGALAVTPQQYHHAQHLAAEAACAGMVPDVEFFQHTRNHVVPRMPQGGLVAAVQSLLDDHPGLAPLLQVKCGAVMTVMTNPGPAWQAPDTTPPGSTRRVRRHAGGRDEEFLCAKHGNMRNAKHVQFNPDTGSHECIAGFHCLDHSHHPSPSKASQPGTPPPAQLLATQPPGSLAGAVPVLGQSLSEGSPESRTDATEPAHMTPTCIKSLLSDVAAKCRPGDP